MPARTVLIIFAHPRPRESRVNTALLNAVRDLEHVIIHDLYNMYPDFDIDVHYEQRALLNTDTLVLHHPVYWYSAPSITKEWEDTVLERGFAYGENGDALVGKNMLLAISCGGPEHAYAEHGRNRYPLDILLKPFEQTAYLCGMNYHEPFVTYGAREINNADIEQQARAYRELIQKLTKA
jgi:glutathione-regulated potassium-efflux system ancillary protein KefG